MERMKQFTLVTAIGIYQLMWNQFDEAFALSAFSRECPPADLGTAQEFVENGELGSFVRLPERGELLFRTR